MRISNVLTAYSYSAASTKANASKSSAVKSLEKVVSGLSKGNTQSVTFDGYSQLDSDDYLDTAAAKYFQKVLLCVSSDNPIGASDINDLDTLNEVGNNLNSIADILTITSSDKISKEDRQKYQKLLDYDLNNINSAGYNYLAKIKEARKELGIYPSASDKDTDSQKKPLFKMADILGVSGISAATAADAKASLPFVKRAINAVETQINKLKCKIKKAVEDAESKTQKSKIDDSKTAEKNDKLQFVESGILKVNTSSILPKISGKHFSRKA